MIKKVERHDGRVSYYVAGTHVLSYYPKTHKRRFMCGLKYTIITGVLVGATVAMYHVFRAMSPRTRILWGIALGIIGGITGLIYMVGFLAERVPENLSEWLD